MSFSCRTCSRPLRGKPGVGMWRSPYTQVLEMLCWTCFVWCTTGKIPLERRH